MRLLLPSLLRLLLGLFDLVFVVVVINFILVIIIILCQSRLSIRGGAQLFLMASVTLKLGWGHDFIALGDM